MEREVIKMDIKVAEDQEIRRLRAQISKESREFSAERRERTKRWIFPGKSLLFLNVYHIEKQK